MNLNLRPKADAFFKQANKSPTVTKADEPFTTGVRALISKSKGYASGAGRKDGEFGFNICFLALFG